MGSGADHDERVRTAELDARITDMTRGDLVVFQYALTSLEECLQEFWNILQLDPAVKGSLNALFIEQRKQYEVTRILFDSVVSRHDRFLNLVLHLHHGFQWVLD